MNGPEPAPRRRLRDLLVDTTLFLAAAAFGVLTTASRLDVPPLPVPAWLFNLDQVIGVLGCAALWLRRRWPTGLALTLVALAAFSETVSGAMLVALFTLAVHRPPRTTAAVFGLSLLTALVYIVLRPEPGVPGLLLFLLGVSVQGAAVGWGLFVHHRRRLVLSLRDRAVRAETEAHLRAEQAQHRVRAAIAREMHDVLGHRLSLLSVHAGALEYRQDASPEDVARAARVIRESAHQALQDLREVLGVLRAPVGELPQPTFADIRHLVTESGAAGMRVDLCEEPGVPGVPDGVGRTAFRVVQEALTNARRHAPDAEVRVRLAGSPGRGLTVEVANAAPASVPEPGIGPGQGLAGLASATWPWPSPAGGRTPRSGPSSISASPPSRRTSPASSPSSA